MLRYFARMIRKKGLTDPVRLIRLLAYLPRFVREYAQFRRAGNELIRAIFPVAYRFNSGVNFEYWHQDIFIADRIIQSHKADAERVHLDIGSRVEGFLLALCAGGVDPVFGDINIPNHLNVKTAEVDLQTLAPKSLFQYDSVSCLHVIEHIGLGKYGDKIEFEGHLRSIERLKEACRPGCDVYISFPIARKHGVYFNSGRKLNGVEMLQFIKNCGFEVVRMGLVSGRIGDFIDDCTIDDLRAETEGCAVFCLKA